MITTTTPTYTWNAVAGAASYALAMQNITGTATIMQWYTEWYTAEQAGCTAGTGLCSATPATALAAGAVTWWVATWNPAGFGPWSTGMAFTVP
jgi:hypothetical protein